MALSDTILRGTDQMYRAGQDMVRARVQRKARQRESLQAASEAFAGIGNTIKEYGSFQKARQEEDDVKGVDEDALLGYVTHGPAGGITALTKRPHLTAAGFKRALELRGQFEKNLKDETEATLKSAEQAATVKRNDEIGRHNKQLESYYKTLAGVRSAKEARDAEAATQEVGENEALGAAFADEDPRMSSASPDGMVLPTERSPEDIARRIGKSGKVSPKGMSQVAPFLSTMQRPDIEAAKNDTRIQTTGMTVQGAEDRSVIAAQQQQRNNEFKQGLETKRAVRLQEHYALVNETTRRGQDINELIRTDQNARAAASALVTNAGKEVNTMRIQRGMLNFDKNATDEQKKDMDTEIEGMEHIIKGYTDILGSYAQPAGTQRQEQGPPPPDKMSDEDIVRELLGK